MSRESPLICCVGIPALPISVSGFTTKGLRRFCFFLGLFVVFVATPSLFVCTVQFFASLVVKRIMMPVLPVGKVPVVCISIILVIVLVIVGGLAVPKCTHHGRNPCDVAHHGSGMCCGTL